MRYIIILFLILSTTSLCHAYDLPEIIGVLEGIPPDSLRFGERHSWIGDQNDDGCDDLMVGNNPYIMGQNPPHSNLVHIYYGDDEVENNPRLTIVPEDDFQSMGWGIKYIGNFIGDREPVVVMNVLDFEDNWGYEWNDQWLAFFECGDSMDAEVDYKIEMDREHQTFISTLDYLSKPTDFNGDGYDDLVCFRYDEDYFGDEYIRLCVINGGEEFSETIDWCAVETPLHRDYNVVSGYDVNSDGCDDILVKGRKPDEGFETFWLFLGGEVPDTLPLFEWDPFEFDGVRLAYRMSLLNDVNHDGFDDWGIAFLDEPDGLYNGHYIFYGGEELDDEPDLTLEGNTWPFNGYEADICSGDFNGDGYYDIVTGNPRGRVDGEIMIFFGSRWGVDGEADIVFNGRDHYDGEYMHIGKATGSVGDYNGDGVDDFVSRMNGTVKPLVIFAGNRDWVVSVDEPPVPDQYQLSLSNYPNPFNSETTLKVTLPFKGELVVKVYDTNGRLVDIINAGTRFPGVSKLSWKPRDISNGIYLLQATVTGINTIRSELKKGVYMK